MARVDYDWYCGECDFHTDHYRPYAAYRFQGGRVRRLYVIEGTVFDHQDRTGHRKFTRKTAPGV